MALLSLPVCVDCHDVELTPGHLQKVKAFTQDSTDKDFFTVRAERECPWQCPKMMAASGSKERNTCIKGGRTLRQNPESESGQLLQVERRETPAGLVDC